MVLLEELFLASDGLGRVIGNGIECAALAGEVGQDAGGVPGEEGHLTRAFRTVATGELARSHPIITFEGLERLVWDTVLEACQRSEEHTSELQSLTNLVCRLLLEKKKNTSPHGKSRG